MLRSNKQKGKLLLNIILLPTYVRGLARKCFPPPAPSPNSALTFKLDVPQVFREVVESHFEPLIQLLGKLADHLS